MPMTVGEIFGLLIFLAIVGGAIYYRGKKKGKW